MSAFARCCRRNIYFFGEFIKIRDKKYDLSKNEVFTDCYFCTVNPLKGRNSKETSRSAIDIRSNTTEKNPVPLLENQLPPPYSHPLRISSISTHSAFLLESEPKIPSLINFEDFNYLIRDLNLSNNKGNFLASRLKQWN